MESYTINIKVTPKNSKDSIEGVIDVNGKKHLKIKLTAVPEDSKANKALIKFLSKEFKIPQSNISIVSGSRSKNKIVQISNSSAQLEKWYKLLK